MFVVCFNSKYGFCKYGKTCDKIHFTDICEKSQECKERYCDKRHPSRCYFFETFERCKFGNFCSYFHKETREGKLEKEVQKLKSEITKLKHNNLKLQNKINKHSESKEEQIDDKDLDDETNMDLETLIRQNSFHYCDNCDYKSKTKKGLKIHRGKMHNNLVDNRAKLVGNSAETSKHNCEQCDYAGKAKLNLEIHIATVHSKFNKDSNQAWYRNMKRVDNGINKNPYPYICNICGNYLDEKEDIIRHYEQDHKYIELETRDKDYNGKPVPVVYGIVHNEAN